MRYTYERDYNDNDKYQKAVNTIAENLHLSPSNIIVIASMKSMTSDEILVVSESTVENQEMAFSPIFTDAISFIRTLDMMFADEAKINVMKTIAEDMCKGGLLTYEEFLSATDALDEIYNGKTIISTIESCDAVLKIMRKFELGHVEIFATATFVEEQAMQVDVGVRCVDPAIVFFSNLSKLSGVEQGMLMTAILAKMHSDGKLTTGEASELYSNFMQNTEPYKPTLNKFADLIRDDYVFLCDDNGSLKIGFSAENIRA